MSDQIENALGGAEAHERKETLKAQFANCRDGPIIVMTRYDLGGNFSRTYGCDTYTTHRNLFNILK